MVGKRIFVSAYGCEPGKGSEQGVGWYWVLQLARFNELVVLTRSNNREVIEAGVPNELRKRIHFEYYDLPPSVVRFKRKEKGLYFYYLFWQWGAYRRARLLIKQERGFDYVIALTFGSLWMPTFMHRLPIPFIWGPIGGGEAVPLKLISTLPLRARILQNLRYILMNTIRFNPMVMGPIRRARCVLTRTADTARLIPKNYKRNVRIVLETAISDELLSHTARSLNRDNGRTLRAIYTGRLVGLKNISSALYAVARAIKMDVDIDFIIVGDGPERTPLEELVHSLDLNEIVHFVGSVSHALVIEELRRSDLYFFPSLKEGGVWSLMEAMSVGLPVICINSSGMSIITDETSAIRIEPLSQEHIIAGFTDGLVKLANSTKLRTELGKNARERIEKNFRWENKGDFMRELFDDLESSTE